MSTIVEAAITCSEAGEVAGTTEAADAIVKTTVEAAAAAPEDDGTKPASKRAKMAKKRASTSTAVNEKTKIPKSDVAGAMKGKKTKKAHTASSITDAIVDPSHTITPTEPNKTTVVTTTSDTSSSSKDAVMVSTEGTTGESTPKQAAPTAETDTTFGSVNDLAPDVVMCMRTLQSAQWRCLADALKDLVPECCVKFDKTGLKVISMDVAHVALIHLHAISEFYYCKSDITIGLNIMALYRMLRNLTTAGYLLEFLLTSTEPEYLQIIITNTDKRTVTKNNLKLLRLPDESIFIPTTIFNRVLSMPASDFQRYIRELSAISQKITIKSTKNVLSLSANGTCGSTCIEIQPTVSGMQWSHISAETDGDDEVTGVFHSKYLERFSRPLDNSVELFIKRDYPLVIRYVLASAVIRLVIAPCSEDDEAGAEDDYENAVV